MTSFHERTDGNTKGDDLEENKTKQLESLVGFKIKNYRMPTHSQSQWKFALGSVCVHFKSHLILNKEA